MWAMLLEKAYAKIYGGYWNIGTGGFAEDALKDITGAPSEYISFDSIDDKENFWKRIRLCDGEGYIMVCGSKGQGEGKTPKGIIEGHAYTIIDAHEIGGEHVLEMRNPWGNGSEWNGKWSDNDSKSWTPELRKKHKMEKPEPDGRFFMPYKEFLVYFDQMSICYYEDHYYLSSFTEELESEYLACYRVSVKTPENYYVSLSQPDQRSFPPLEDGKDYQYSSNGILVCTKNGDKILYEGGIQNSNRDCWVKFKVNEPTDIYIFVKTNWLYEEINEKFGLSVYGPEKVEFTKMIDKADSKIKLKDILYKSIFHKAKSEEDGWKPMAKSGLYSKMYSKFEHSTTGYGFYAFRNKSNKNIQVKLTMTKSVGVRYLMPKADKDNAVTLKIPKGESMLTIWDIYSDASSIGFKTSLKTYLW